MERRVRIVSILNSEIKEFVHNVFLMRQSTHSPFATSTVGKRCSPLHVSNRIGVQITSSNRSTAMMEQTKCKCYTCNMDGFKMFHIWTTHTDQQQNMYVNDESALRNGKWSVCCYVCVCVCVFKRMLLSICWTWHERITTPTTIALNIIP